MTLQAHGRVRQFLCGRVVPSVTTAWPSVQYRANAQLFLDSDRRWMSAVVPKLTVGLLAAVGASLFIFHALSWSCF